MNLKHPEQCDIDPFTFEWKERVTDETVRVHVCSRCQDLMAKAAERMAEFRPYPVPKESHLKVVK